MVKYRPAIDNLDVSTLQMLIAAYEDIAGSELAFQTDHKEVFSLIAPAVAFKKRQIFLATCYAREPLSTQSLLKVAKEAAHSVRPFEVFVQRTSTLDAAYSEEETLQYLRMFNSSGGADLFFRTYQKSPVEFEILVRFMRELHPGGTFGGIQAQVLALGAMNGRLSLS